MAPTIFRSLQYLKHLYCNCRLSTEGNGKENGPCQNTSTQELKAQEERSRRSPSFSISWFFFYLVLMAWTKTNHPSFRNCPIDPRRHDGFVVVCMMRDQQGVWQCHLQSWKKKLNRCCFDLPGEVGTLALPSGQAWNVVVVRLTCLDNGGDSFLFCFLLRNVSPILKGRERRTSKLALFWRFDSPCCLATIQPFSLGESGNKQFYWCDMRHETLEWLVLAKLKERQIQNRV